ncbi:MAG: GNAT family N-acetyltransferase [Xanthobacteraceae bacterium]|nr:GNAT family N-acetyltransferase [Xanthobacteraceae bacterium]
MDNPAAIRSATPDDADRIRTIARAAYVKYMPRIGCEPEPMLADFAALIGAGLVVVAEDRADIKGYMVGWPKADAYFIDNIAVGPEHQGQGIGRHLIEYAATEAKRLQLPAVRLYTNVAMTENLAMYAHIGFVETHRAEEHGFQRVYLRWSLGDRMARP